MELFAPIASLLIEQNTQNIAEALLSSYCSLKHTNFINLVHLLFLTQIYDIHHEYKSKPLKASSNVLRCMLKHQFCAKSVHSVLKHVKRNQLLLHRDNKLMVNDIIHMQKETVLSVFLQCRTNPEKLVMSKILRGDPALPRQVGIDALAQMCNMRYHYIVKNFCYKKESHLDFSKLLMEIFDLYPNYLGVAELLRTFDCDLPEMLERGVRATIGYPVRQQYYVNTPFTTVQIHYDCRKKMVKFFHAADQQLWAYDENYYEIFENFISVAKECILDVQVEEYMEKKEKRFIIYPLDVLLYDGVQCNHQLFSKRRDILRKIVNPTTISIRNGKLTFSL